MQQMLAMNSFKDHDDDDDDDADNNDDLDGMVERERKAVTVL